MGISFQPSWGHCLLITDLVCRINFDHSYWNFGGEGSPYNYVDAALKAGHATFIYDRLGSSMFYTSFFCCSSDIGVGESAKPDGIKEVQEDTETEVAAELIKYIRRGETGYQFQQIIGIGHSAGRSVFNMTPLWQDSDLLQVCTSQE